MLYNGQFSITALHGSAKHCYMGRSAKYRNTRFRPPVEQKRATDQNQIWQGWPRWGVHLIGKKIWGSIERWCPHTMAVCQTFVTVLTHLFFPNQPTAQTSLSPTMYYASNDVVSLIHVPFGGKSRWNSHFWGLRPPKTAKISPLSREIPSETKVPYNLLTVRDRQIIAMEQN